MQDGTDEDEDDDDDDDDGRFEAGAPMTMVARGSVSSASGHFPCSRGSNRRRRTMSESPSPSPLLRSLLTPPTAVAAKQQQQQQRHQLHHRNYYQYGHQDIRRNASTPGFGRLARMSSHSGNDFGRRPEPQQGI